MPTVQFTVETPIAPEALVRALTDFSPDRPKHWRNIDPDHYKVHAQGGGWERNRYDWSQPGLVTATVQESNSFAPGSYWRYQIAPDGKGGSRVTCTVLRRGKGAKGQIVATLAGLFGKRVLKKDFELMLSQLSAPPIAN